MPLILRLFIDFVPISNNWFVIDNISWLFYTMMVVNTGFESSEQTNHVIDGNVPTVNKIIVIFVKVRVPWRETRPAVVGNILISTEVVMCSNCCSTGSRIVESVSVNIEWTGRR